MRLKLPPPVLIGQSRLVHVPALQRLLLDRTAGWFSRYEDVRVAVSNTTSSEKALAVL